MAFTLKKIHWIPGEKQELQTARHNSNSLSYIRSEEAGKPDHLDQGKKEIHEEIHDPAQVSKQRMRDTGAKSRSKNSV